MPEIETQDFIDAIKEKLQGLEDVVEKLDAICREVSETRLTD